jgi:hypothetical protein
MPADVFASALQYNLNRPGPHIDCDAEADVNGGMQMTEQPAFPPAADFASSKSIVVVLAGVGEVPKAGDLADAAKWAATAASSLRGAQSLSETA